MVQALQRFKDPPANTGSVFTGSAVQAGRPAAAILLRPKTAAAAQLVAIIVHLAAARPARSARPAAPAADSAAVAKAEVRLDAFSAGAATSAPMLKTFYT